MKRLENVILESLKESLAVKQQFVTDNLERIVQAADMLAACIASGHKILIFGNGGSAADAQHIAAEFVNRFRLERPPLAALALTTDSSVLTSIANDFSFDEVFSKQIQALGRKFDIAWGMSTSGRSVNVIHAMRAARQAGLFTMGFSGSGGGDLAACVDLQFSVNSGKTARIQETHMTLGHMLCDLAERILFGH